MPDVRFSLSDSQKPGTSHASKPKLSREHERKPRNGTGKKAWAPGKYSRPRSAPAVRQVSRHQKTIGSFTEFAHTPRQGTNRVERLQEMLEEKANRRCGVRLPAWRACTFREVPEKPFAQGRVFPDDVAKFLHNSGFKVSKEEAVGLLGAKAGGASLSAFHDMITGCPNQSLRMPHNSWPSRLEAVIQASLAQHSVQSGGWPLARNQRIGVGIARDRSLPNMPGAGIGSHQRVPA
eukprot:gnl/MRDRNA2_/MRDRNA2_116670_c0_seq1.p1 gnl/MRDRNA2_/MRDRNA2_116670_c0~~gnl/MRDRNA2_/MRDRNA2_116670_c0_seq1.p1  ORF type:complete len:235 (+),score=27.21 gnl/MRDRNA2_/MRDRNA2_116670_c0_seq1:40-744(+)